MVRSLNTVESHLRPVAHNPLGGTDVSCTHNCPALLHVLLAEAYLIEKKAPGNLMGILPLQAQVTREAQTQTPQFIDLFQLKLLTQSMSLQMPLS